ncbi:hypothetical protein HK096_001485, partial [Nowakowskiella sp. JEL0078]
MGLGIAHVISSVAKLDVTLVDANQLQIDRGFKFLDILLSKDALKGKITDEEKHLAMGRVQMNTEIESLTDVDFVIEAVSENIDVKRDVFSQLDKFTPENAILATNTSSISITAVASSIKNPEKVIGMHFMNPVPIMKLVEIIPGLCTSVETLSETILLAKAMGKTTTQSSDMPGFIANRILMPYINEAGIATREHIDTTMKLGTNVPMGPLTLADFIGLDTCLAIMKVLHSQLGDSKYRPAPLLQQYVDAGWLGKKSGRGFYDYEERK